MTTVPDSDQTAPAPQAESQSWLTVVLLWWAGIVAAMQFAKMSIGFDAFREVLSAGPATVSALLAACGFFGLIFGIAGASITARLGFRRILLWSLVLASGLSLLQAMQPGVPVFYLSRLLEGATNLFIVVAAPVLIVRHAPSGRVTSALALWGTFYGVAFALGGAVGPMLIATGGTSALLTAHAVLTIVIAALLRARTLSDPPNVLASGLPTPRRLLTDNIRAISRRPTLMPGLIFFFHSSIYLGLLIFVPLLAPTPGTQQMLLVGMPLVSIAATLATGPLAARALSPETMLSIGFPSLVLLAGLLTSTESSAVYGLAGLALMAVSGLMQGAIFILPPRLATDFGDEALAFGLIAQLGSLGSVVAPVAFEIATRGVAIGHSGTNANAEITGFTLLLAGLVMTGLLVTRLGLYGARIPSAAIEKE